MSCWTKEQLEGMLEDVVNELDLSEGVIGKYGPLGTSPAVLVKLVLQQKDEQISMLKSWTVADVAAEYGDLPEDYQWMR